MFQQALLLELFNGLHVKDLWYKILYMKDQNRQIL